MHQVGAEREADNQYDVAYNVIPNDIVRPSLTVIQNVNQECAG